MDISIAGDELEQHRIALEHNLMHTDLSLHLSSDEVEYPRHASYPSIPSFSHIARPFDDDDDDEDDNSRYHRAWSYRATDDDDHGPYAGETLSTAAHHASALTLSAGLGGPNYRRDISFSGAEYDPERPITNMVANMAERISVLDIDTTKSRVITNPLSYDPLVLETSTELDHIPPRAARIRSPAHTSSTSSASSRPSTPVSPGARPKLSDALNRTFSPKRPKGNLPSLSPAAVKVRGALPSQFEQKRAEKQTPAKPTRPHPKKLSSRVPHMPPEPQSDSDSDDDGDMIRARDGRAAPVPHSRRSLNSSLNRSFGGQSLSYAAPDPEVHVLPPTPPTTDHSPVNTLKLTQKNKHGDLSRITRELEERARLADATFEGAPMQSTVREKKRTGSRPSKSVRDNFASMPAKTAHFAGDLTARSTGNLSMKSIGRIHLPDLTGLTTIVASPAKPGMEYLSVKLGKGEVDARIVSALSTIQTKLTSLESQNSVSRRRVRELEMELETCKKEVHRERTRVIEKEEEVTKQLRAAREREERRERQWEEEKERERAREREREREWEKERKRVSRERQEKREREETEKERKKSTYVVPNTVELEADRTRYLEVVEEKKALENLITTLRTHLTRLTTELHSHSQLLSQLKELRETDVAALREKAAEVERLGKAVERLEGEVVVLRGVVEEGLRERRDKENSRSESDVAQEAGPSRPRATVESASESESEGSEDDPDNDQDPAQVQTRQHRHNVRIVSTLMDDKTMRTDYATVGSAPSPGTLPDAEATQLEAELETSQILPDQGHQQDRSELFISRTELTRISEEMEERRSEISSLASFSARSNSRAGSDRGDISLRAEVSRVLSRVGSRASSRAGSVAGSRAASRAGSVSEDEGEDTEREDTRPKNKRKAPASNAATVGATQAMGYHDYSSTSADGAEANRAHSPARSTTRQRKGSDSKGKTPIDETPFPQIRGAHMERLFFSAPEHDAKTCTVCHRRRRSSSPPPQNAAFWGPEYARRASEEQWDFDQVLRFAKGKAPAGGRPALFGPGMIQDDRAPPQTVLARVLRELEDDFSHYKSIYTELAEQYRVIDAVSNVAKRNVLAGHLKDVIGVLEQRGDQIASLYDLLTFKDKPVIAPGHAKKRSHS